MTTSNDFQCMGRATFVNVSPLAIDCGIAACDSEQTSAGARFKLFSATQFWHWNHCNHHYSASNSWTVKNSSAACDPSWLANDVDGILGSRGESFVAGRRPPGTQH
ncbi:hypothetical protein [Paraherbaspirillum soli]|uniref:Uncharacterized protein n=1 Tax=Paraherbaspirillum soli TaxID=631222 RepID=A0ABW0M714_9BURK